MARPVTHETEHSITVAAAADAVFALIEDVGRWPVIFSPTVHAERIERHGNTERIRIWASANDAVKGWTSRRELDPAGLRVRFRQEVSPAPVAAMGGTWVLEPLPEGSTRVRLLHDFSAVDDDPVATRWIRDAVDRNSDKELAALRDAAEQRERQAGLLLTFSDEVRVAGPAKDVYDFLDRADAWPRRLPHVDRVELTEETPGTQTLEMDTRTADGSTHTTKSVRICFPYDRIVYKQLLTPALMSSHTGEWTVREDGAGTVVTSTHTVVVAPGAIPSVLGANAGVAEARAFVRDALGRNSTVTMRHAKEYAEGVARG